MDIGTKQIEKNQLEADIRTIEANTSKTPQEVKTLNEKKLALQNVTYALDAQKKALKEQTNAWSAFAAGMKKFAQSIVQEIQNIIAKMIAMKIIGAMIGLFASTPVDNSVGMSSQAYGGYSFNNDIMGQPTNAPGYIDVMKKAEGGLIPLSMGKAGVDSVPAMLMPGEIIIKKSSVDYYGADKLLALNEGKIQKFANGGLVGSSKAPAFGEAAPANQTLQIVNIVQGQQVPDPGANAKQVINVINQDLISKGSTYNTVKAVVNGGI